MKFFLIFSLLVYMYISLSQPIELTEETIEKFIQNNNVALILFYSPNCGHCKRYLPIYKSIAEIMAHENPKFVLAQINSYNNSNLRTQYKIRYYPILYLFINKIRSEIKSIENYNDMVSIIESKASDHVRYLLREEELDQVLDNNEILLIFTGKNTSTQFHEYLRVSNVLEDIQFYHAPSEIVSKKLGINDTTLLFYKKYGKQIVKFTNAHFNRLTILDFVEENIMNSVGTFNERIHSMINDKNKYSLMYFHNNIEVDTIKDTGNLLAQVKSVLNQSIPFLIINESDKEIKNFLRQHHFDTPKLPRVEIVTIYPEIKRYLLDENFSLPNLINFIQKWEQNKLEMYCKSEDIIPDYNFIIKKLVGKNFWTFINNTDKDVIVNFYSPYCKHSNAFKPLFLDIANQISNNQNLIFAEINRIENDVKDFYVNKTPSIFLFKKSPNLKIVEFIGERSNQSVIEFLQNNLPYPILEFPKEEHISDL